MEIIDLIPPYTFAVAIEIIIQIMVLHGFRKKHKNSYWKVFLGITITTIILNPIVFITFMYSGNDLNEIISSFFIGGFSLIFNIIIIISGLIIKHKIKKKNELETSDYDKKTFIKTILLVIVVNMLSILIPLFKQFIIYKIGESRIDSYLIQKYGDGDFQVVKIEKKYEYIGISDKVPTSYNYEIKSNYTKGNFVVIIDSDTLEVLSDYFLHVYYSEQENLYYRMSISDNIVVKDFEALENYINNKLDIKLENNKISNSLHSFGKINNNKKIPSIEQFIKYLKQENQNQIVMKESIKPLKVQNMNFFSCYQIYINAKILLGDNI